MTQTSSPSATTCGFVAVIGAPNAGKSTLVNALVGEKVSIVSPKVQTTRARVLGIALDGTAQMILIDTPGLFAPQTRLDRAMVSAAWNGAADGDVVVYVFDAKKKGANEADRKVLEKLKDIAQDRPVILVLNKVDLIDKPKLLVLTADMNARCPFAATFMISALNGDGVADIKKYLSNKMPHNEWIFDAEQTTDMPMRLLAAEITREQVFLQLHEEIPYAITVETEVWEEFDNGDVRIQQLIHVEHDKQKAIVLGKGGTRLREIGARARAQLEEIFGRNVHLKLFVRVTTKWKDDPLYYAMWGLGES
ncbi:MAG: GTPase Era [Pseudobdellovibrionaceae bacterium]